MKSALLVAAVALIALVASCKSALLVAAVALIALVASCKSDAPRHLEIVEAQQAADIAPLIASERTAAVQQGKQLVVYVGASWCEPCRRFHDAAIAGQLDATFPGVRMLAFDADRDAQALAHAGYTSNLIPLFALPNPDGTASDHRIEGSIKGEGAVGQIVPRLQQMLDR